MNQPIEREQSTLPTIRLEHIWVLLALSVSGMFISMVPTAPNDFWWHLKAGALIADSGIPTTNLFAWTLPTDAPYIYQSWLGEWLFFILYRIGSFPLIVFTRNMLALTAFALVAVEAKRRSGSWRLAAGAVLLVAAMTINNLTTRTQNWSWVPFMLTTMMLGSYVDGKRAPRWLIAIPVLMVFWVNVHGAFVMGILVVGAFAVGETLRRLLRHPYALPWERLRWLYGVLVSVIVAACINPLGPGVYRYVLQLLSDAPSQSFMNEWQSPTPRTIAGMFFFLSVLVLIVSFAFARRKPSLTDVLLVCGITWQAFVGIRYVIWFGMVVMPIVAQSFAKPRTVGIGEAHTAKISLRERGGGAAANMVVAIALVLAVVAFQPWFKPMLPLPEPYFALFADIPGAPFMFTSDTPVKAVEYLRSTPCQGNIFNEMGYGSYMDWALYPQAQVFIDPRVELYPLSLWQDYVDLTRGYRVETLLNKSYHNQTISCVLLDKLLQPRLAETLATLPAWERTYADERSEVWRRRE